MKKIFVILIFIYLVISCKQNENNKKNEQRFLTFKLNNNEFIEVDIDSLTNFEELLNLPKNINCRKNHILIKLETNDKVYKIQPMLQFCGLIIDYKLREVIYINTDSITVNYELKYPIDSLKMVMINHFKNPKNDINYPLLEENRLISINVRSSKKIIETKKLLLKIIDNYNELNMKNNFLFMFQDMGILPTIKE